MEQIAFTSSPRPDRFIPQRNALDVNLSNHLLTKENQDGSRTPPMYKDLAKKLFNAPEGNKILAFKQKAPLPKDSDSEMKVLYSCSSKPKAVKKTQRHVSCQPELTLEAPNLVDDYYLNLLDWNCNNVLAIGLQNEVFLWNGNDGTIEKIECLQNASSQVTSVGWTADGAHLAIGTDENTVQLWDANRLTKARTLKGHSARVSSLSWNKYILSSGSKDNSIINHDVRVAQHMISTFQGHSSEVCGLKWSPKGDQLASGGNDNILNIWDAKMLQYKSVTKPVHCLTAHQAAVKALSWAPFQQNLLVSGGGTGDRCLRFWNTQTGAELESVDTGSQVCAVQWAKNGSRELISSHGFARNQLTVWNYPSLVKVADNLTAHSQRVLHMAISPDGTTVATAAGDERLCFWKVFDAASAPAKKEVTKSSRVGSSSSRVSNLNIR